MEAIAFNRLDMQHIPINSFKGFTGHTLGAAGVIETALCIACMHENTLLPSAGYHSQGTTVELNLIKEVVSTSLTTVLKTASGFGGCNASLLLQKLDENNRLLVEYTKTKFCSMVKIFYWG